MTKEFGNGTCNEFEVQGFPIENDISLPVGIFCGGASCLEAISKYLKDVNNLKYCKIASMLNRDGRTIWGAYSSAKEKSETDFCENNSGIKIPLCIFKDRSLSTLEALAEYLREELNLRYCKIAALLGKDQRTIWTVCSRAKKKRRAMKKYLHGEAFLENGKN